MTNNPLPSTHPRKQELARKRSQNRGGRTANSFRVYSKDGTFEYMTIGDIAEQLDIPRTTAQGRLYRAQKKDGPITREMLGLKDPNQ